MALRCSFFSRLPRTHLHYLLHRPSSVVLSVWYPARCRGLAGTTVPAARRPDVFAGRRGTPDDELYEEDPRKKSFTFRLALVAFGAVVFMAGLESYQVHSDAEASVRRWRQPGASLPPTDAVLAAKLQVRTWQCMQCDSPFAGGVLQCAWRGGRTWPAHCGCPIRAQFIFMFGGVLLVLALALALALVLFFIGRGAWEGSSPAF